MKKKQNLLLLVLAVLFVSLFSGSTAVSAASFPRLEIARTGEIVSKNNNLYYRYSKRNYARNKYLRIKGKNYYFDNSGKAWYGMHTTTAENITLESVQRDICTETVCSVTTRIITT